MFRNFVFSILKISYSCDHLLPLPQPHMTCSPLLIGILCGMDCYLLLHPSGLLTGLIVATLVPFSHFQFHGNYFVKVCIKSGVVSVQIYQTICLFQKKRGTTKPLQAHALKCPDQVFCPSSFFSPCYCFSTKSQRSQLSDA